MPEDSPSAAIAETHSILSDVRAGREVGQSENTLVNRLYYACFHAARAALLDRGIDPKSHDGLKSQIGQVLVQPGEISGDYGRFFREMSNHRDQADYTYYSVPANVDHLLERTEEFVATMETLVAEADEQADSNGDDPDD